ncbi:hypothetical protein LCGC14_0587440 [marine sediment metagenome]|uniref:Uncharacterized protein n=1 Tax=marine sediment metagenome TaxID=412755 RepID=A0A0F9RYC6_9ZZZZ|nr:MAG: hypothetical protein Lokiarch_18330 [Candidatus Lokiarchaeum sp. GC14_75]HEC39323.1 hypothetical protein [bacterium]
MSSLLEWYFVTFDNKNVYRDVRPSFQESWKDQFEWNKIIRICFQTGDLYSSDELYIFIKDKKESFLIPMEANGGLELWGEIIDRRLFDADLAIKIASESEGMLHCWPEITRKEIDKFSENKE